jgi:hypothetical protein
VSGQSDSLDPIPYVRGLAQLISQQRLEHILARTGAHRTRRLSPASVVWLVIAMSLFADHSVPLVWRRLHPSADRPEPDPSAFTKARARLGVTPLRDLFRQLARPIAAPHAPGAFWRGLRLMGIDGTTFDLPDTPENDHAFGRGGNQRSAHPFPQMRVLALCELGTHAICNVVVRPIRCNEQPMVPYLLDDLRPGMLLLWDRAFYGFELIRGVLDRGCRLLMRVKANYLIFRRERVLPDGSYLSKIYASYYDRTHDRAGRVVRIVEYTHNDPNRPGYGVTNRLLTDLLDPVEFPARELVALYHRRWEQELAFDEIKTHLNGRDPHLRSKTPGGAVQELYGLLLAHRVLRQVMQDAAGAVGGCSERLSFTNTLRVVQCRLHESPRQEAGSWYQGLVAEVGRHRLPARRNRWYPRVIKRQRKKWHKKRPDHLQPPQPTKLFANAVLIT